MENLTQEAKNLIVEFKGNDYAFGTGVLEQVGQGRLAHAGHAEYGDGLLWPVREVFARFEAHGSVP